MFEHYKKANALKHPLTPERENVVDIAVKKHWNWAKWALRCSYLAGDRFVECADSRVDLRVDLEVRQLRACARRAGRADAAGRDLAAHGLRRRRLLLQRRQVHRSIIDICYSAN